uniref:Uncharacterized protein n=1 Tax=Cucumis sativus TaxID=3659 RepID=A0A0A0LUN9_CUCSA
MVIEYQRRREKVKTLSTKKERKTLTLTRPTRHLFFTPARPFSPQLSNASAIAASTAGAAAASFPLSLHCFTLLLVTDNI